MMLLTQAKERIAKFLRELQCSHDMRTTAEPGRIFQRCPYCGKESHGWKIDGRLKVRYSKPDRRYAPLPPGTFNGPVRAHRERVVR